MMASYSTQESFEASSDDIKQMMVQKAHELFSVCDKEEKGFITKRDMQRLQVESVIPRHFKCGHIQGNMMHDAFRPFSNHTGRLVALVGTIQ